MLVLGTGLLLLAPARIQAQASIDFLPSKSEIVLRNPKFRRVLNIDPERGITTSSFRNEQTGTEVCQPGSDEFAFRVEGQTVTGAFKAAAFAYRDHSVEEGPGGRRILRVRLQGKGGTTSAGLDVTLFYEIYPDVAVVRKWLEIVNRGTVVRNVSEVEWERLNLGVGHPFAASVFGYYGQAMTRPPYVGGTEDPAIAVLFDGPRGASVEGFIVGNEAPSVMKRTEIYPDGARISITMNREASALPFRCYLQPGATFRSPKGFLVLQAARAWQNAFEGDFATFIRKYMGVKLFERRRPPMFVYSPYMPFDADFSEKLYHELIDQAAASGVDYFQVTWGWTDDIDPKSGVTQQGDYRPSPEKFPNGLGPVIEHIRAKGMKPCLYFSVANADRRGRVFKAHPEWAIRDSRGEPETVHSIERPNQVTMCLASPWSEYIYARISEYVERYGIEWLMLDLSSVASAYVLDKSLAGCHAKGHLHKDRDESLYMIYERMMSLFDRLKERFPGLYIDCTFELWGAYHVIDYALIEHADGDWMSNIDNPMLMRQLRYDRGRVVPPSPMLIGNLRMDWDDARYSFDSLVSSTVVMLGDLRELTPEQTQWFKKRITWLTELEDKYQYSHFYQTGAVFSRPTVSGWDGCTRFNPEKDGGIVCLYRDDSPETTRTFAIGAVNAASRYRVHSARQDRDLGIFTGEDLQKNGLTVTIPARHEAEILSLEPVQ
jgi:alpha-galactosidase